MAKFWFRIALINFFVAACMGVTLRYAFVEELAWLRFRYFLHGHSHVAMLGWGYQAIYALLLGSWLTVKPTSQKVYEQIFVFSQAMVVIMLLAFPIQGYGMVSITASSIHTLLVYWFIWQFWRDTRQQHGWAIRLMRTALVFLLLSTVALWAMGPIIAFGYTNKPIYYLAIQFYLHFQFNGWFAFVVLGLFIYLLEQKDIQLPSKYMQGFYGFIVGATVLTYALAVAWAEPIPAVFAVNSIGVMLQLIAMAFFVSIVWKVYPQLRTQIGGWSFVLIKIAFACFAVKILVQAMVVVPYIATVAYTIRNFVIGFIHLILLGVISLFLMGYAGLLEYVDYKKKWIQTGVWLFLLGLAGSEFILILQGLLFWGAKGFLSYYYETLCALSALMPLGLVVILLSSFFMKKT